MKGADFSKNGFAIYPGFFSNSVIDAAVKGIDQTKQSKPDDIVVDMLDTGERTVLALLSDTDIQHRRMKINDLFLTMPEVRSVALDERVVAELKGLLGNVPVLCNSLYFEKGSAQPMHIDSLYMTPRTPKHLIAIWVALEDTDDNAGPLEYYPGSHLIEQMRFSNGSYHFISEEMGKWNAYMEQSVARMGLKKERFAARKGDVFVWHANLFHGGSAIRNPQLTRKSLVFHYYSESDCRAAKSSLVPEGGAYWMQRPQQQVPPSILQQLAFKEDKYLERYPDVANAVKQGAFVSGRHHYELFGKKEGRLPC